MGFCGLYTVINMYNPNFPVTTYLVIYLFFSLKLETWIRLNKIPYENVHSIKFSKKGQIPYIELNGEQIADSNIIIPKLKVTKYLCI